MVQLFVFYAPQLYRQVLLRARISYGNSVRPSVCLSVTPRPRYGFKARWDRDSGSSPYDSVETSFLWGNLVPLVPLEWRHQRGVPPLRNRYFTTILAHLAWKRLQIDADLLLIITSTADELFSGTNIDDLERPWTPEIWFLSEFFAILGCGAHLEWILNFRWKILEIDQDNLRTKLNWCCRASHEH